MAEGRGENKNQSAWSIAVLLLVVTTIPVGAYCGYASPQGTPNLDDITGKYHFLSADDTLGILEEEGKLKGYIEVAQGAEESDDVLSYEIVAGLRKRDHVEFKTNIIHRKYYRFAGKVERGSGRQSDDPDYVHLVGDVEAVTVKGDSGQESVVKKHLVLKCFGKAESKDE
jgi:hypothetical protein